ncbi:MAG: META domain-containing protein, partial [Gammaproteobacteria bacterium]|nr:META domain-containing protein [Gammaproteobacteria bacterium]
LISIEGQPVVTKAPPEDAHLTLSEGDSRAAGYSGCNRFFGDFELAGEGLKFGPLASTRQSCVDSMQLENDYLAALARGERFEIVEQELRLYAGPDMAARFVAVDPGVL